MFGLGLVEMLGGIAIMVVLVYFGLRVLTQLAGIASGGRRPAAPDPTLALEERTARLEENLATMTEQLERVVREQEFTNKLLGDRARGQS